jgi:radical SAM superfamily enzyme YgiQ (UPF0313 family)
MEVFILNPPAIKKHCYIREGRCMQKKSSWSALWYPMTLGYLSAVLKRNGHIVFTLDCSARNLGCNKIIEIIKTSKSKIVILNTSFPTIKEDALLASSIKRISQEIIIVVIGMLPTLIKERIFRYFTSADYAVAGEPEWVINSLVESLDRKWSLTKIGGLLIKRDSEILQNCSQELSKNNLDTLPFPDRDGFDRRNYRYPLNGLCFTLINISRGCHHDCSFCTASQYYGKKIRKRSVESILEEIEECIRKYKISNYLFWCESFTSDKKYSLDILDKIIKSKFRIGWSARGRVDELDEEQVNKMKQAGCRSFSIGIESTDAKVLELTGKKVNLENINNAINLLCKSNIISVGHVIFGLPGDTPESATRTINYLIKSNIDFAQFYCAVPYPNTRLWKMARENGWLETEDLSNFELSYPCMSNETMDVNTIKRFRDIAYRKFYFRPKIIKTLSKNIKTPRAIGQIVDFKNWIFMKH